MSDFVTIVEVGPRDGLQNEKHIIPTACKIELVDELVNCGFKRIEVTSFVSPKWVPQLADAAQVMAGITRNPHVRYSVLTPNRKGMELALKSTPDEVAIFTSASQGFCERNINCTIEQSLERFEPIMHLARERDIPVRGYVSCVVDCPYDGRIEPAQVAHVAQSLISLGCHEISLGDTIGSGTPERVDALLNCVLGHVPAQSIACHFHDTNGQALENIALSLHHGIRIFDSAVGGLGGCPYAPGAKGNVATEKVVRLLADHGFETGVDLARLETSVVPLAQRIKKRNVTHV